MVIFLLIIILVLAIIIYSQHKAILARSTDLNYIIKKLGSIIANETDEKLLVFTDDKELRSLLIELNKLLEYKQKISANFTKTEISMRKMLSNVSHDLKTPLTVILGYMETLKINVDISNEERANLLNKVWEKAGDVLALINKFFDLAKLESGDKGIPLSVINLNEVCRKNILQFYDVLNNKGIEVDIDIPEKRVRVLANAEALDRILNNLIFNAINYGSDGKVLGISLKFDDEYAYVHIWDRGKGISTLHIEHIFERMYTLEDSRNKLYQGSGLGLTITKRLVEKLGGEITVKSLPYKKTTFSVKLKKVEY